MAGKMATKYKSTFDRAIGWLKNTTIDSKKIADYIGLHGKNRTKFLVFAKEYRKELWEKNE